MAAHSTFALMQNASEEAVMAARAGDAPSDPGLGALYRFARVLVARRGHVSGEDTQALLTAGYSPSAVLDLVAQVAHTTMANFAHSISHAPVDEAFAPRPGPCWTDQRPAGERQERQLSTQRQQAGPGDRPRVPPARSQAARSQAARSQARGA
jgi:hypothetical protein